MKILVLGATGYLGSRLVAKLDFCETVRCLVRATSDASCLDRENIELVRGDLLDHESLDLAMQGMDAVVHSAVETSADDDVRQRAVNVTGALNVIEACRKSKVKRLVYLSAVGVLYPASDSNNYIESKKEAEALVLEAGLNAFILRPSLIYDRNSKSVTLLKALRLLPICLFPGWLLDYRVQQPVYAGDVIAAIQTALTLDTLRENHPYNIAGPDTRTLAEIIDRCSPYPFPPLKLRFPAFLNRIMLKTYKAVTGGEIDPQLLAGERTVYHIDIGDSQTDFSYQPAEIAAVVRNRL